MTAESSAWRATTNNEAAAPGAFFWAGVRRMDTMRILKTLVTSAMLAAAATILSGSADSRAAAPATVAQERASVAPAPARAQGEGVGPFPKMVIRSVTLIDGSGAPPRGPVDIVIENNRITAILSAGFPNMPLKTGRAPADAAHEIDGAGMYIMPGLFDLHMHIPNAPDMSYFYKLYLGHGVTSIRPVSGPSVDFLLSEKARSARNEIAAPRIYPYQNVGQAGDGWSGRADTPERVRAWVAWAAKRGVDGIGEGGIGDMNPELLKVAIDEARKQKMGAGLHLPHPVTASFNALQAAEAGTTTIEHFYGHFEALLRDTSIQPYRAEYNFNNEIDRWKQVPDILPHIYEPGSPEWTGYLQAQKKLGTFFDPTFTAYEIHRSFRTKYNAEWHDIYDLPQLWDHLQSDRTVHGMSYYDWSSVDEARWRRFITVWMRLTNDFKNMGGRVTLASDAGGSYTTYGVSTIEELMFFEEAGFTAGEAIRAGTYHSAQAVYTPKGEEPPTGVIRVGKLADIIVVPWNPVADINFLLEGGALRHNIQTGKFDRLGGIKYTIKDGIVYDAGKLRADVKAMVASEKRRLNRPDRLPRN